MQYDLNVLQAFTDLLRTIEIEAAEGQIQFICQRTDGLAIASGQYGAQATLRSGSGQ